MTTSGDLAVPWIRGHFQRLRANWPAVLLPLVAVGTLGLFRADGRARRRPGYVEPWHSCAGRTASRGQCRRYCCYR
jgi:hypothetical protein